MEGKEKGPVFIAEGGCKLGLKSEVISRALLFLHHFQRQSSDPDVQSDELTLAAACLSLSLKTIEDPKDLKEETKRLISVFYNMLKRERAKEGKEMADMPDYDSDEYKTMAANLLKVEKIICAIFEYRVVFPVAHQYLSYFYEEVKDIEAVKKVWQTFTQTIDNMASFFYMDPRSQEYRAKEIAFACVQFAVMQITANKSSLKDLKDVNEDNVITIQNIIADRLTKPQETNFEFECE